MEPLLPTRRIQPVSMENSFSGLTIDDTSEFSETGAPESTEEAEESPEMPPVHIERIEDELEDEFHFQILLLIEKLHKIKQVVLSLWEAYRDGQFDVVVPSLATNIAIDLIRQSEAEFDELAVRPKKYPASEYPVWTLPVVFYLSQLEQFDKDPKEDWVKPGIGGHISTDELTGVEDLCFYSVFWAIRHYVTALIPDPRAMPYTYSYSKNARSEIAEENVRNP
jgi:hypothetical protein